MTRQKMTAKWMMLVLLMIVLHAMWPSMMQAQVVGATLSGVVGDSSGATVPGAKVSIRNVATGDIREVTSNEDGLYSAPNLLPGTYEVSVSAQGFSTLVQKGINLTVGAQQALNFSLKPGQVSQSVEVTDIIPAVQSNSSSISATVDSRTVRELPLNGRDWTSLATLEPGVAKVPNQVTTAFSANKGNRGFGNQLTDSGHRPNENSYRVNGVIVNDYSNAAPGGATGLNLGVDGVQEFSVVTTGYTAEYGRTSGAIINAITKSGANQFHGDAYFFDRDKIFDAKNYFDPPGSIPSFRRIQFGGSAGGAIIKDKTFIFGDYEGVRQDQPASQSIHVPTAEARSGLLCVPSADGSNPCASLTAVAVSPSIVPYLALWPCPASCQTATNADVSTLNVALAGIARENYVTGRLDQKISANDSLAASYFFDSGPQTQPDPLQNAVHQVFSRRQMGSIEDTHIFSPQMVNTLRLGVNRVVGNINTPISGDAAATNSALAIAPGARATPQISVAGLTTAIGLGGLNRFTHAWTSYQAADDAFITRGTHQIKVGFAFERMDYNILEQLSPNGRMNGYSLAHFLTNTPDKLNALAPGGSNEVAIRESLFAGYIQDDWRARSNLTVNLGLRYEATTKPNDANNRIQEITTLTNCSASPTACGPVHLGSFIAKNPTVKNFEPRIGFAYDPFKNGKTAIRGAFGMFDVLPLPYEFGLNTAATFPFQIVGNDPNATLGTGVPDPNVSFDPTKVRNRYVQQDPKRALVMNWNFNVQRELSAGWTVLLGYVASRSVHLSVAADDINLVQPITTSAGLLWPVGGTAIDPNWAGGTGGSGIRPVLFDGASSYESFQAQIKKAMSHRVQGQLSYALGQCKDTSSAPVTGDTYANSIAVPILFSQSYRHGPCDFDLRHVMSANLIWDVPGPTEGPMSYVLGGWELGTIITVTSGSPFTPTIGAGGDPLGTGFNGDFSMDFANITKGCNPIHGGVDYLNVNCFGLPQATADIAAQCVPFAGTTAPIVGTCANLLGNAGRNSLYGPGLATVDFSVFKNFRFTRISEAFNVQFRAEFFNILNHTNFSAPNFLTDGNNNSIFDPNGSPLSNAGVLASTTTTSRQIQFGLKVIW
ncbi:MAG: hypothetical protein JWQ87_4161 [Candidatus Sulfotelmatobacter sp.]|nr:hypothetical protein [Candidatus Sulfotelmatobacter sp.]